MFGRLRPLDPIVHIGSIQAPNRELAEARAHFAFRPMRRWLEMVIVGRHDMIEVIKPPGGGIGAV